MFSEIMKMLIEGFGITLALFLVTLVFAVPLGLPIALGARSRFKVVRVLIKGFVWIIRGTPLMLQVLAVSLLPRYLFGVLVKDLAAWLGVTIKGINFIFVSVAFIINYACYFSEIYRSGIESIPAGQYEAGKVLGLKKTKVFSRIILLQVVKRIVPPMGNEVITLVKDTSLAQIIGVVDLLSAAKEAVNAFVVLTPLLYAAVFYLIFNGLLTLLLGYTEKKLGFFKV